jgi:hypothetical protein
MGAFFNDLMPQNYKILSNFARIGKNLSARFRRLFKMSPNIGLPYSVLYNQKLMPNRLDRQNL